MIALHQLLKKRMKMLFLIITLAIASLPVVVVELVLIFSGWASVDEMDDPFIGLSGDQTLFVKHEQNSVFQIRKGRQQFFRPASFASTKPSDGFRVFVLGGSTVQGRPWETETAFPQWLEICLNANLPNRTVEVVNCGGVSYASYRLKPIFNEVLAYQPDLLVLCVGHNEFLEDRTYATEKRLPDFVVGLHRFFMNSRTYQYLRTQLLEFRQHRQKEPLDQLADSVVTRLDFENGLNRFSTDSIQRNEVVAHFRFNIQQMISAAADCDVPLLVLAPPVNQKDCFPFKPSNDWDSQSVSSFVGVPLENLESDANGNSHNADFCFSYGDSLFREGRFPEAKIQMNLAIENDLCPLRMTKDLRETLELATRRAQQRLVGKSKIVFIDLQTELEKMSAHSLVGDEFLVDHVHPSIGTHQLIARWITKSLQQNKLIRFTPGWEIDVISQFESKVQTLDFAYFQRGKDRLASVIKWSRGKAIRAIPENRP